MVNLKTQSEIDIIAEAGRRLRRVVKLLSPQIKPGITTYQIDKEAERLIYKFGGEPSFKKVRNYNWTTCLPINEQVVHTPPAQRMIKEGDVLTVDIGLYYQGFHTDYATSFIVGDESKSPKKTRDFLKVGKETLEKAIKQAGQSVYVGEITKTIQDEIYHHGYFILRELTGHGVGHELHEEPYVPGILDRPIKKTYKIKPGLVLAIEVIYSMGTEAINYEKGSDWSILTADGSLSACFEHTIAFTDKKVFIVT